MKQIPGPALDTTDGQFAIFHASMTLAHLREFVSMSQGLPDNTSVFASVHQPTDALIAIRAGGIKE